MGCPKCQCEEISATGMCLWCGYQANAPTEESEQTAEEPQDSSLIPAEASSGELPEWRQQLPQRLVSIKQKREGSGAAQDEAEIPILTGPAIPESKQPPVPKQSAVDTKSADSQSTQKLIDEMTSSRLRQADILFRTITDDSLPPTIPDFNKSPMMLLSRTLSGLVDLIIIGISTIALIVAADIFSGIQVMGLRSVANYAMLFLLIYFVYSLFFFRISGQTIGMMTTNLRMVTGMSMERPRVGWILARCCAFLVSLLCFGIGLLWALFDQEHLCFHDRVTNTRVVRI